MTEDDQSIYSPSGRHRAKIIPVDSGQFVVETHAYYEEYGLSGWENTTIGLHIFGTKEEAKLGAIELLRNDSGEQV